MQSVSSLSSSLRRPSTQSQIPLMNPFSCFRPSPRSSVTHSLSLFIPFLFSALFSLFSSSPLSLSSDLFKYRLINSRLINSTFLHNKEGCLLSDISDENNAYMVYFVSFLGTLAVLPGNIVSALLMDKIGRLRMLGNKWAGSREGCAFNSVTLIESYPELYCKSTTELVTGKFAYNVR